jgi:membrane associated rhomboid family serine protease
MHGETTTLLLLIILGFTTWQGLNRPGVMAAYLFSTEAIRFRRQWIRLVSPAFLHGSWRHFAGNALTLFFFGRGLENAWGPWFLLSLFFCSVAGGHGLCMLLHRHGDYRAVGASGGTLGLLFAAILLMPGMTIMLFPLPIPIPAWFYAVCFLFYTLSSLRGGSGVSHEAHLGGLLTGVLVTLIQFPARFGDQPWLILFILAASLVGIYYFHMNPGRVPGFWGLQWRGMVGQYKHSQHQRNDAQVDELLDKVSKQGLHSLSDKERTILQNASRRRSKR